MLWGLLIYKEISQVLKTPTMSHKGKVFLRKRPRKADLFPDSILELLDPPNLKSSHLRTLKLYDTLQPTILMIASSSLQFVYISTYLTSFLSDKGIILVGLIFHQCHIFLWVPVLSLYLSPLPSFQLSLFIAGIS